MRVLVVEQSVMSGHRVVLDPPVAVQKDVGPKLLAAAGAAWKISVSEGVISARVSAIGPCSPPADVSALQAIARDQRHSDHRLAHLRHRRSAASGTTRLATHRPRIAIMVQGQVACQRQIDDTSDAFADQTRWRTTRPACYTPDAA